MGGKTEVGKNADNDVGVGDEGSDAQAAQALGAVGDIGSEHAPQQRRLNDMIRRGEILAAFERFYADDVAMQEGLAAPTVGKAANREREQQYLASVAQFHGADLIASAVNGSRSYSEWVFDATYQDGKRVRAQQVSARTWRDGKIVHERFFSAA